MGRRARTVFAITAAVNAERVAYDAATDGCFPLVSNAEHLTPAQILAAYRYQPNLERRHHMLKGPQQVAPVFLNNAHRIQALLLCHFLAMLTEALIEREIRNSMKAAGLTGIPLYPELRNCPSPSAPASWRSSPTCNAINCSNTSTSYRPSSPNSAPCTDKSSNSCTSPKTSTPQPAPSDLGADINSHKCGTSVPSGK